MYHTQIQLGRVSYMLLISSNAIYSDADLSGKPGIIKGAAPLLCLVPYVVVSIKL